MIKNFQELATTQNRRLALSIAEAGLAAINTERVMLNSVRLENNNIKIADQSFNLSKFKKIKVVGFGKASCEAALALEKVLGSQIAEGAVIGLEKGVCNTIETFAGTHPRPSMANIVAGEKIYEIVKDSNEDDLIIALVSGGGSSLLCASQGECDQGVRLYDSFLKSGKTISEINTVRKHLSVLKGGGLAKLAYPATLIGLIFSDVPGSDFSNVASGPTYKDETTVDDAQKIIVENNLGNFNLVETPKEDIYFEKVYNFVVVSNVTAVQAMAEKARELGLEAEIISTDLYDEVDIAVRKIFDAKRENKVILAAGEPALEVTKKGGSGGRSSYIALRAASLGFLDADTVFLGLASDGMDNSDAAGAIVDLVTLEKAKKIGLDLATYVDDFNSYNFFQKTGDMIMTGPTGANVSDLMILVSKN